MKICISINNIICAFFQLKLLLIAIESTNEDGKPEISLNPGATKLKSSTVGYRFLTFSQVIFGHYSKCRYFIAQDADEVRRVLVFCKVI